MGDRGNLTRQYDASYLLHIEVGPLVASVQLVLITMSPWVAREPGLWGRGSHKETTAVTECVEREKQAEGYGNQSSHTVSLC